VDFEDKQGQAHALLRLGDVAVGRGDQPGARERYLQALKLYRECSDKGGRALAQVGLARVDAAEGDRPSARTRYLRALELAGQMNYAPALAEIFLGVATMQVEERDQSGAATALAFLQAWENAPLAVQQQASTMLDNLGLRPAARQESERQAATLSLDAFCTAIDRVLHAPGAASAAAVAVDTDLSRRELQVLALLDRGYTNNAVAKELGLTVSTVKWYCTQIFGKLGASNRTTALAKARELGLLA
jgi:ATP/maltotriose-dependent transcriptional regulator MalT